MNHFTIKRVSLILVILSVHLLTQLVYNHQAFQFKIRLIAVCFYALCMFGLTLIISYNLQENHKIKTKEGYSFDPNDVKFQNTFDVLKLASFCFIAAVLCGCTGIAGGLVLGPLFLSYNMLPLVMGATNQYIGMLASSLVCVQFMMMGNLNK